MATQQDVLVIGGGIAGISAAAWLAPHCRVLVLERESQPGYHATGRSAAIYTEHYGNQSIRALTRASGRFLKDPPAGFSDHPILTPRGALFVARPEQASSLARLEAEIRSAGGAVPRLDAEQAIACLPVLRPGYLGTALLERGALAIDVHALLQGYLRMLRAGGGAVFGDAEVTRLERRGGLWHALTRAGSFAAPLVVNAAGAWADTVAELAGLPSLGLTPLRRSVLTFDAPDGLAFADWPMLVDIDEQFYLKPEAGRFLLSPADETPSPPCDAQPDELDLAIAIDRLERATTLTVPRIRHRWAGLRTFAPDRTPVMGFARGAEGFVWLAGQGGYGIQTSAALGQAAAALLLDRRPTAALAEAGVEISALDPARFEPRPEGATPPSS